MFRAKTKGQSILEYAVLMGVIVAVIIVLQIYVKRAVQGNLKAKADQIGEQFTTGQAYTQQRITQTARQQDRLVGTTADPNSKDASGNTVGWEKSYIEAKDKAAWTTDLDTYQVKGGQYKGAEISVSDYVTQAPGQGRNTVDSHTVMDSGVLKDKKLFGDDQ